ncbi:hypothetical protein [Streptomyces cylindrosporus]|uniref:Helix-turn-helix domain-containing protein n=1 Tax=Streptomyces cylindrosporus TaxID=2927583 RepID=A0ABS9YRE9_9ACTN|nr:hypothetical protein [Streptomyces cylindrosporus]MCI3279355.1 hypothetical protein [Streptomyces cylindrosporus]
MAGNRRHLATAGGRLCRACHERLSVELGRLPGLYEACGRRLDGRTSDPARPRTSGGPLPGMPFNAAAAEVRAEVLGVLGSWAGAVVKERRVTAPRRAVLPLAAFLDRHLDWLAGHDAAGEFSGEVARLVRHARRVVDPEVRTQVPIGACVEPDCTGSLTAVVRPQQPRLPAVIRCDRDPGHLWLGHEWLQLGRRLNGTARAASSVSEATPQGAADPAAGRPAAAEAEPVRWVSAADVARLWGVSTGSVYRHASESRWRRRSRAGRTYYHGGDVVETLKGRGAA